MLPTQSFSVFRQILKCHQNTKLSPVSFNSVRQISSGKEDDTEENNKLVTRKPTPKEIFQREFPDRYDKDGKYNSRIAHVDFIDDALFKMKELGLARDLEAYKELIRIFPPGKYFPTHHWDAFGFAHAPQQLAAVRVMVQMEMFRVKPDKELLRLVSAAFSVHSNPWLKASRSIYWSMKGRNVDPNPLPEILPEEPHKMAKLALARMTEDQKTIIRTTNTSRVADSVDKTWLVFSQSPTQQSIIERLPAGSVLYVEEGGNSYIDDKYLTYFTLKYYLDEKAAAEKDRLPERDFNYHTVKVQFYGRPIREKIKELEDEYYMDGGYLLSTAISGTSSQDSLLSWMKLLQERNPNLNKLSVVFRMARQTPEMIEYDNSKQEQRSS